MHGPIKINSSTASRKAQNAILKKKNAVQMTNKDNPVFLFDISTQHAH